MIDLKNIYCASSLHDCCGVVFEYEGKFFRALLPRGIRLFDLLNRDGWMQCLFENGLARIQRSDLYIPGYQGIIELERLSPIVPPFMWTTNMLGEAGLVVCKLSKELLRRGLVIWDLKGMTNMTFSAQRGPLLIDIGAIYTIQELENHILRISEQSLFEQIISSFYAPIWLACGPFRHLHSVERLLEYRKTGEQGFAFVASLLRRLTIGWKIIPGLIKAKSLLYSHQYEKFYDFINYKIQILHNKSVSRIHADMSEQSHFKMLGQDLKAIIQILDGSLGGMDNKVVFDLFPEEEIGLNIAEYTNANVYLVTSNCTKAEEIYAWRKKKYKNVLPILCDIWDRSFQSCSVLREGCDLVYILPDIFEAAVAAKVPLDFVGRVLSMLTRRVAVVGIGQPGDKANFPSFVCPPESNGDPVEFVRSTVGKYFRSHEIVRSRESSKATILILRK